MTSEERRRAAVERTRVWKEKNPWMVKHQNRRRWERVKAALEKARNIPGQVTSTGIHGYREKTEERVVQETHYAPGDWEMSMGPNLKGGQIGRGIGDDDALVRDAGGRADDQNDDWEAAAGAARSSGADVEIRERDGAEGVQQRRERFERLKADLGTSIKKAEVEVEM